MATLNTKFLLRRDTAANWTQADEAADGGLILSLGEPAYETDTNKLKIGDGRTKWSELPYITDTISAADIKALTNVSVSDDDIVVLSATKSGTTVTITGSHAEKGPAKGYTSANSVTGISGSGGTGTIKIPQFTVDKYGHITAAADEDVVITMPTIPSVTAGVTGTGNVITAISTSGHAITATKGISVYTKDEVDKKIGDSGVKSVSVGDDNVVNLSVTMSAGAVTITGVHATGGANTSKGATADVSVAIGATGSIKVPYATVNTYGHTTTLKEQTLTIDLSNTYTKKDIDDKIGQQVASAVQYLGTVGAEASLSVTAGKGDFYRSSASFVAKSGKTIHAGDIIIAEKDKPTATIDSSNWSVIHGEEVGVESVTAADTSIIISGSNSNPSIKVNTGFTSVNKNYAVKTAANGLYVNVPWENDNTEYSAGTGLSLSGTTFNHSNSVTAKSTAGLIKIAYDAQGHITSSTNVAKSDITALGIPGQDTTYDIASSTTAGLVKIGYTENGKNYPVELDSNNKMFVNVPWTDSNHDSGYGKITISNGTSTAASTTDASLTADTHEAGITFKGANEWVVVKGLNGPTSGNDLVEWSHKLSSLTAGNYGPTANVTGNNNATIKIPQITTDAAGHITGITERTLTLKNTADTNTWREIKVGNTSTGTSITGVALQLDATKGLKVAAAPGSTFKVTYSLDIDTLDGGSATTQDTEWGTVS